MNIFNKIYYKIVRSNSFRFCQRIAYEIRKSVLILKYKDAIKLFAIAILNIIIF